MAPTVPRVKTPEDEVQEVSIEMTEDVKPLGTVLLITFSSVCLVFEWHACTIIRSTEVISSRFFLLCLSR